GRNDGFGRSLGEELLLDRLCGLVGLLQQRIARGLQRAHGFHKKRGLPVVDRFLGGEHKVGLMVEQGESSPSDAMIRPGPAFPARKPSGGDSTKASIWLFSSAACSATGLPICATLMSVFGLRPPLAASHRAAVCWVPPNPETPMIAPLSTL